jgi:hypothetical protein
VAHCSHRLGHGTATMGRLNGLRGYGRAWFMAHAWPHRPPLMGGGRTRESRVACARQLQAAGRTSASNGNLLARGGLFHEFSGLGITRRESRTPAQGVTIGRRNQGYCTGNRRYLTRCLTPGAAGIARALMVLATAIAERRRCLTLPPVSGTLGSVHVFGSSKGAQVEAASSGREEA